MKKLSILFFLLFLTGSIFAQENKLYNTFDNVAELQKFQNQGGKIKVISQGIYKLTYRTGESRTFNINSKKNEIEHDQTIDTTIINIWEIDTTRFSNLFTFWQKVEVATSIWSPLPVEDLDTDGRPELYGFSDILNNYWYAGPVKIFERSTAGIYQDIYTYDSSTIYTKGIGDIKGYGNKEILLVSHDSGEADVDYYPVFINDSSSSLPTTFDFFFYLDTLQINDLEFGDYDNNGITDCAYTTSDIWDTTMCAIAEYRININNFEQLFMFSSIFESDLSGFAIDDFDQDGKTELVISSGPGNVFVIENTSENQYSITNQFPFPTYNAYMHTKTNDIDGNGKPEFWIGGQDFENGITVLQCYESYGDNNYKAVALIELRYLVSLYNEYIQAVDIDADGKEELIISIGNNILILKFVGSPNNHIYKYWYAKIGESTQPGAGFLPVTIADLDGDGNKDLLIPMEKYTPYIIYELSYILKNNLPLRINNNKKNDINYEYIKSYPNPFNSQNTITFGINKFSNVQIKIFNILGKEINILLNKELSPGEYNIQWDAKDKYGCPLSSGIYFICLQTGNAIKTTKTILLK